MPLIYECALQAKVDLYVFGSALSDPGAAADVDLILVYDDISQPDSLRACLDQAGVGWLVDITALTRREDYETGFRAASRSVPLAELVPK